MTAKIKEARLRAGLTQEGVTKKIGIPRRTLQDWEAGRRKCPEWAERLIVNELERIANHENEGTC